VHGSTVITDVAGVATAIGVLFGAGQLLLSRSQATTTFEDALSVQYRQIIKPGLLADLLSNLESDPGAVETVAPYYEYFDLCNEQIFLRLQGRVRRRTWREWQQGIEANLGRGAIKEAWLVAHHKLDEFGELRLLDDSGGKRDPRRWNPLWRRVFGRELPASDGRIRRRILPRPGTSQGPPPP
jgi:hypothetical protein